MRLPLILPLFVACLAASMVVAPAFAADKAKKESTFGTGKGAGAYLTRDQLRTCLDRQNKMAQTETAMQTEKAAVAAEQQQIVQGGDELKQKLEVLDKTNAEAVAAYNDSAQARDKQIDAFQTKVTAFNAKVEAAKAERDSFGQSCNNRRYFEEDEIAIRKGK